jgi:hypothetical protein
MTDDIVTRLRNKYQGQLPIVLEAADEIERLRAEKSGILTVGNSLLNLSEADSKCQCRREWVCHRCQAIDAWKSVCND